MKKTKETHSLNRKEAEKALKQSEAKYRNLFETMLQGVVYHAADGTIISANKAAERILGLSLDQMMGRTSIDPRWKAIHEDGTEFPGETHPVSMALKTGKEIRNVVMGIYYPENESYRWINVCAVPQFKSRASKPYQVYATFDDITERCQAQEALRESKERLNRAELASLSGNWEFNLDTKIVTASEGASIICGLDTNQMNFAAINEIVLEEFRPQLDAALKKLVQENQSWDVEFKIRKADTGEPRTIHSLATFNPETRTVFGIIQDITRQKRIEEALRASENNYRLLTRNLPGTTVFLFDHNLRYVLTEGYLPSELGFTTQSIEGKTIWEVLPPERADRLASLYKLALEGKPTVNFISQYKDYYFLVNILPVRDEQGEIQGGMIVSKDITERKKVELALKESETKFQALFAQMNEGFAFHEVIYDANHRAIDYRILDSNLAFEKQTGISPEKAKGALASQLYGVMPAPYLDRYVSVAETGHPLFFETYFPPLGKYFEISVFSPSRGYFATTFTDSTERKKTENALRESEEKWRKLVQTIPDYIALYDRDGKYLFLNHFAAGFSMKDIEGKTYTDFLTEESKTIFEKAFGQAKTSGQNQYFEYTAFGDNYTLRNYETYVVPLFENNEFVNMLVIARDITERKQMEEALRESEEIFNQFMEHSPIYIFFKDETIRSIRLSRNYEKLLGKKLDKLLGKSMNELFPSDIARQMEEDDLQILKLGEKVEVEEELNNRCYSTIKFPIQLSGKPRFLAGFTMDITERKLAEAALKENEARLREAVATKDKFFSIIAHDLKNPFNSILGFSDLLVEQVSSRNYEGIEEYAAIIRNSSQRVMDLLMNLLEWSRSQTGRMEYNPEFVELPALINQVRELLEDAAHQKSITIELQISRNFRAIADKAMLSATLRNLISNAVKFTRPGGLITVSVAQKEKELFVSIADNGVGIKKELMDKLFMIEDSYSTEGTQKEKGTGLGLILCKEFIGKHGGRIWAESEPGKGSTFYFTLPLGNS